MYCSDFSYSPFNSRYCALWNSPRIWSGDISRSSSITSMASSFLLSETRALDFKINSSSVFSLFSRSSHSSRSISLYPLALSSSPRILDSCARLFIVPISFGSNAKHSRYVFWAFTYSRFFTSRAALWWSLSNLFLKSMFLLFQMICNVDQCDGIVGVHL